MDDCAIYVVVMIGDHPMDLTRHNSLMQYINQPSYRAEVRVYSDADA